VPKLGDPVVEKAAARAEHRGELLGVDVDLGFADVLDHPDGGDCVEVLAGELAVVLDANLDSVRQPGLGLTLARELGLGLRQGDPDGLDPVPLRGVITVSAAADIATRWPGQVELRIQSSWPLRFLQGGVASRERSPGASERARRRRSSHRAVQEEREELGRCRSGDGLRSRLVVLGRGGELRLRCRRPANAA
jgi:hypothetical protein